MTKSQYDSLWCIEFCHFMTEPLNGINVISYNLIINIWLGIEIIGLFILRPSIVYEWLSKRGWWCFFPVNYPAFSFSNKRLNCRCVVSSNTQTTLKPIIYNNYLFIMRIIFLTMMKCNCFFFKKRGGFLSCKCSQMVRNDGGDQFK